MIQKTCQYYFGNFGKEPSCTLRKMDIIQGCYATACDDCKEYKRRKKKTREKGQLSLEKVLEHCDARGRPVK